MSKVSMLQVFIIGPDPKAFSEWAMPFKCMSDQKLYLREYTP